MAFLLVRMAPGGPFDGERRLPPQVEANLRAAYHLDEPLVGQYVRYPRHVGARRSRPVVSAEGFLGQRAHRQGAADQPCRGRPGAAAGAGARHRSRHLRSASARWPTRPRAHGSGHAGAGLPADHRRASLGAGLRGVARLVSSWRLRHRQALRAAGRRAGPAVCRGLHALDARQRRGSSRPPAYTHCPRQGHASTASCCATCCRAPSCRWFPTPGPPRPHCWPGPW